MKKIGCWINKYKFYILIFMISIFAGIFGEVVYNLPIDKQNDYQYIDTDSVKMENFVWMENSKFHCESSGATLTFEFEKQYVDKLTFGYASQFESVLSCEVIVQSYEDGETPIEKRITDNNNYILKTSVINIREVTDKIIIKMGSDSEGAELFNIAIDNTGNISEWRMLFVCICTFLILSLVYCWIKKIVIPLEIIFLCISMSIGLLGIGALPTHKVGCDEEIHFGRAYFWGETIMGEDKIEYPAGIEYMRVVSTSNWPYLLPKSEEEYKEENAYRNIVNDYDKENSEIEWIESENGYEFELSTVAYIFQWLMIKFGMLLGVPFSVVYRMGRMGNLILYSLVVFVAIRHLTRGKRILFVLALMPVNMLTAMTYSYDAWVNAFAFLGASYLIEEWFGKNRKVSYKNFAIIIIAFVLSSLPKAVYIPLIALFLFIPKDKFNTKKEMYVMKSIIILVVLMMLSTFVLPALISPSDLGGDSRGGDTSVVRQLSYIFLHPIYYAEILLTSIKNTFFSYAIGQEGLGRMGHLEPVANGTWILVTVCYVVFTDYMQDETETVKIWQKSVILFVSFCVICLIWTALYLSYTPVGANSIAGVQGRYYLPVTIWMLWALRTDKIRNVFHKSRDYVILTVMSLIILLPVVYNSIISVVF